MDSRIKEQEAEDKSLLELFEDLWRIRFYMLAGAVAALGLAALFLVMARPHFEARMILAPANPMEGADISSLRAEENMYALGFILQKVGAAQSTDFQAFQKVLSGPRVAQKLVQQPVIIEGLSSDGAFTFSSPSPPQEAAEMAQYLERRVHISAVGLTPMRQISYLHPDPDFAKAFISALYAAADGMMKEQSLQNARERALFLQAELESEPNPDHRKALAALLTEQERVEMLSRINQPFAAKIIEPAAIAPETVWPNTALVIAGFLGAGLLISFSIGQAFRTKGRQSRKIWFKSNARNMNEPHAPVSYYDLADDENMSVRGHKSSRAA